VSAPTVSSRRPAAAAPPPPAERRAAPPRRRHPGTPSLRSRILVTSALCVAAIYFLLPVYWLAIAATKTTGDLFGSFGLWFADPQPIANLRRVFTYDGGIYLRWAANSVVYAGAGALAATLLAAAAGYALAKYRFGGREALFNAILAGVLVPMTALALPLYLLFTRVGLANSYLAVLIPSAVSPFGVYLCRIYAEAAVPDEVIEAARIDGAGELTVFRVLALRIMTPALVTVFLFQFVGIWNNYFLPLVMLSNAELYPITLGLTAWQGFADRQPILYQLTVGGSFVSVVPLMIAILVLQRYWRTGLTEGSVKG
jgi:multiple sugar transport system permease protein